MNVDDLSAKGEYLLPMAVVMGDGISMMITTSKTDKLIDAILRAVYLEVGTARAGLAIRPQDGRSVKTQAVPNTISLAWRIGRAVHLASSLSLVPDTIIEEAGGPQSARKLFEGTIVDVKREWRGGHMYGTAKIHRDNGPNGEICIVPFKNENIAVQLKTNDDDAEPRTLSSVPDLIAVLDADSGRGTGAMFEYSPGMKVFVIAIAASPRWTKSRRGLELGGPAATGYEDIKYIPVGNYSKPRSVIEEFNNDQT